MRNAFCKGRWHIYEVSIKNRGLVDS